MKKFISIIFILIAFSSCGEYQKALKSEDVATKYEVATKEYDKGKYARAIQLYEQIAPSYRGKPQAEKMFYSYAQSLYKTEQYYSASYQFESFVSSYPKSEKVEECAYLGALSYSKLSPVYSLDQADTYKAIDKLENFISEYPGSPHIADANAAVKSLRDKLEKKAFEIAKQYNTISDYKASLVVLDNFIADYPGSIYKEQALFYKLNSSYHLAINSIPSLMEQRLYNAKQAYDALIKFNSNTEYKSQADNMLARIENDLKQFSK